MAYFGLLFLLVLLFCNIFESVSTIIAQSYIVEYTDTNRSEDHHQIIETDLSAYNDCYQVHHTYSSPIFHGMSFTLKNYQENETAKSFFQPASYSTVNNDHPVYRKLKNHPSIKRIFPVYEVPRPQSQLVLERDLQLPYSNTDTEVFSIHEKLGIRGNGILIGILDSGVDYHHPALGSGFGRGYKIRLGKNLVPAENDEKYGIVPLGEDDPFDPCLNPDAGHGTHVSGIIAGYSSEKNFTGIAPNATLAMFRIFGCEGGASEDTVIKAMLMAYDAGCKIINLSLGIENSWPEDAMAVVAERLSNKGVIVVGVAGNQGSEGLYSQNSPGTGKNVVAVASVDNSHYLSDIMTVNVLPQEYFPFVFSSSTAAFPNGTIIELLTNENVPFACNESMMLPPERVAGKILLVQRGHCTFDEKIDIAKAAGAIGILFYDPDVNEKSIVVARTKPNSIPCAGIELKLALRIVELIKNNNTAVEISFPKKQQMVFTDTARKISQFSSTGPTYELDLKPSITGIGGNVFSTLPLHVNQGWGVRSGTSMASPHVAGTIALLLEYYLKAETNITTKYIVEQLQNHAKLIDSVDGIIEHPLIQGAGLIQPLASIYNKIHVSPAEISFNDTASFVEYKTHTLKIENTNPFALHIKIKNRVSQSILSYPGYDSFTPTEPIIRNGTLYVDLQFSSEDLILPPNSIAAVEVKVVLPRPEDVQYHYQMYGGFIAIEEFTTSQSMATVPYFGVLGRMIDIPIFDKYYPYLAYKNQTNKRPLDSNATFQFNIQKASNKNQPVIVTRLLTGSASMEIMIFDKNDNYVGIMSGGPWIYNQRNKQGKESHVSVIPWDGTILNNSSNNEIIGNQLEQVPDGTYYIKVRALKHFGNPKNKSDWVEWTSNPITVHS